MRKIFVADAHLKDPRDPNYRALVRFLDTLPDDTDTLYLLGDLFEFWVGNEPVYPHYDEILGALKRVRGRGLRIVYFEGNHDFHLARFFASELQAEVHTEGAIVELGDKKVYLCHGDQLNRQDLRYRVWRRVLHSRLAGAMLPIFPARLKGSVALRLSQRSGRRHGVRRLRWDYPSVIRAFAGSCFASGCAAMVTGHFHVPFLERHGEGTVVSLGDWITHYSYAQWVDGKFSLERFTPL